MKLIKSIVLIFLGACLFTLGLSRIPTAFAQDEHTAPAEDVVWTAEDSNPNTWGWMEGSPPPVDRIIRFDNGSYFKFPQMRWSVCHFQQLMPTKAVSRRLATPMEFEREDLMAAINQMTFMPWNSTEPMTWEESLGANFTDGIVVLHKGRLVYENYFGCLSPLRWHAAMSMTKSFVGLLGAMLVEDGTLDETKLVREYIPELSDSAFGDATVRQVLDMTTGLDYSEDYADPNAGVWQHAAAGNPLPKPADYTGPRTYFKFLQTVQKQGEHGVAFGYKTINTDVLGWLISRVTGESLTTVLSEKIWSKIGPELDAFMTVDSIGTPFAGGGLNAGLRDMARFGQMMLNDGTFAGEQVVPESVVADIRQGGDKQAFAAAGYTNLQGWSYRNMWWITHNEHGAYMARGVHGQALYIDPTADMVIARFASNPVAGNAANDPTSLPAYEALANFLMEMD
jgi:CubicO group peptidase (beta-lactamase class C family)